jgi:ParB-like chromosome segregation protein Spo0J
VVHSQHSAGLSVGAAAAALPGAQTTEGERVKPIDPLSRADVELVPIDKIEVGIRRRKTLGPLGGLKRSIAARGLIHPIVIRNGHELVVGARRLEACRQLGWSKIPARRVEALSDAELRAVELEENSERQALLDFETSQQRLAEIRQAEADAQASEKLRGAPPRNRKAGRPKTRDSRGEVAERTGIARRSRGRLERHVEIAQQYPFLQAPEWSQSKVLKAGELLKTLPASERPGLAVLFDQPAIVPKAIQMMENLTKLSPARRQTIYEWARSKDPQDRRRALTEAAALPPPPDRGVLHLLEAERLIEAAREQTQLDVARRPIEAALTAVRAAIAVYPHPKEVPS